jgi:hypothetical protein
VSDASHELLTKLEEDLLAIYTIAGREVTYVAKNGERKAYWPHRYLQAVRRAIDKNEVLEFVETLVTREAATRGFGYLEDAGRQDLTVEAIVVDESKPYHHLFSPEAIAASAARLAHVQSGAGKSPSSKIGLKLSSRAQSYLDALAPHTGGKNEIENQARQLAQFEDDSMVRGWHVLSAAESYTRRPRAGHDSV